MTSEGRIVELANGLSLSYLRQGDPSGPPVVFVPGPTDSAASYRAVLDHLPPHLHAVAVSPRGHGDSDKPPSGYAVSDFAADLVLLLDALGLPRAGLVGHSGSCLALRGVALDHPARVAGLVLEASPTTLRHHEGARRLIDTVISELRDPIDADFVRSFIVDTSAAGISPDVLDELVREAAKVPAGVWREMFGRLVEHDDTAELHRIEVPVRLIWGDADPLVTREVQEELVRRLRRAQLVVYPGVGHTPRFEDPARFAADVAAFLG